MNDTQQPAPTPVLECPCCGARIVGYPQDGDHATHLERVLGQLEARLQGLGEHRKLIDEQVQKWVTLQQRHTKEMDAVAESLSAVAKAQRLLGEFQEQPEGQAGS